MHLFHGHLLVNIKRRCAERTKDVRGRPGTCPLSLLLDGRTFERWLTMGRRLRMLDISNQCRPIGAVMAKYGYKLHQKLMAPLCCCCCCCCFIYDAIYGPLLERGKFPDHAHFCRTGGQRLIVRTRTCVVQNVS